MKFVFATTEPEKVLQTIRSRTHHYPFRLMPRRDLTALLDEVVAAEGIAVEPQVMPARRPGRRRLGPRRPVDPGPGAGLRRRRRA